MLIDYNPYVSDLNAIIEPAAEHLVVNHYVPDSKPYLNSNHSTKSTNQKTNDNNHTQPSYFSTQYSLDSIQNGISVNIDKFAQRLKNISATSSSRRCARSIRLALESAGAKFGQHPIAAADWGNTLVKIGYKQISPAFDQPREGDIYIIDRTAKHRYGHIAGFSGSAWVSDFQQRSHDVYKEDNVTYTYYRLL
ncbi:CHAP domain-containing protein [Acinetobacter rudis]|uniref:CHAP domain-containing protein n=1 Tax=Acinetobacter rudis TaxID=632955 RepID=A0AAW8J7E0_9GAMM|nr:CHAP domain-containing protein [Acinetobacter rudis]MDQ8935084.1 CHAP domain-containing protein [Acinetobacter rudis]MDQ8952947.1 CHAP domain-containing protein [Acinetobacter rudis]MDQ9016952.1 CHAP domain-containing protein [Acinetobacter rudis]